MAKTKKPRKNIKIIEISPPIIKQREKIVNNKEYKVVKCYWHDIVTKGGWVENKEIYDLSTANAITYGLLVDENKDYVKIAQSTSLEEEIGWADVTVIPMTVVLCIKQIDVFNPGKETCKINELKKNKFNR